jgi:hypothetical protein
MRTAGIVAGALMTVSLFAGRPVASQDPNPVQPPNWEQEQRKLGPGFEHLRQQQPYRDLGQYPALRGEAPSAAAPRPSPPIVRCNPQPSVRPSYDRPSSAASPPSCGPN